MLSHRLWTACGLAGLGTLVSCTLLYQGPAEGTDTGAEQPSAADAGASSGDADSHRIVLDMGAVGSAIPIPLRLTGERVALDGISDPEVDLRFTDDKGNRLPVEVTEWQPGIGVSVFVLVPEEAQGEGTTTLYLDLGAGGQDEPRDSKEVWSSFAGVWHMASGKVTLDAAANHAQALMQAGSAAATSEGIFDSALQLSGGMMTIPTEGGAVAPGAAGTIEVWAYFESPPRDNTVLLSRSMAQTSGANSSFILGLCSSGRFCTVLFDDDSYDGAFSSLEQSEVLTERWYYFVGSWDEVTASASSVAMYIDGARNGGAGSRERASAPGEVGSLPTFVGCSGGCSYTEAHVGLIDEVRLSPVRRSEDWIRAQYRALTDGTFATWDP